MWAYLEFNEVERFLGCTWRELLSHLESQFNNNYAWSNMDAWEIDHIIPLSSAKNKDELKALWHYKNLQPLNESLNSTKGAYFKDDEKKRYLDWYSENVRPIGN